jgi:UDP-N-acetylglucosamine 2-epimerase (non-hydrolysing)
MKKILMVFGTRPEAVKLCPLICYLRQFPERYAVRVCVTAQHRKMLDDVLRAFRIEPDYDLDVMLPEQTLFQSTSRILAGLETVFVAEQPDLAIVQGDTTTTLCGALAAFYSRTPLAHVEAGLRTGDLCQPYPEELNRVLVSRMAALHFAATEGAARNLTREGVPATRITVTGNTGIDAVLHVRDGLERGQYADALVDLPAPGRRLLVVTAHRRESLGEGLAAICAALARIADRNDIDIVYPVHPNPAVREPVERALRFHPNIHLTPPLDYVPFVDLMRRAWLLMTDSGGVQEEGPSLGKPVLVLREKTERPEAVEAGAAKLVGADRERIVAETLRLLDSEQEYRRMCARGSPYGDGHACQRIEATLSRFFG